MCVHVNRLVAYGDLLAVSKGEHSKAQEMYQRALQTQPLKTIQIAILPGHHCSLCSNSSRLQVCPRCSPCRLAQEQLERVCVCGVMGLLGLALRFNLTFLCVFCVCC